MGINRTSLTSETIQSNTESVIEIREVRPVVGVDMDPPDIPGRLIGYYNGATGWVELYVVSGSGRRLYRI